MNQVADIQPNTIGSILEILRKQALAIPTSSTSTRYLRALESLSANVPTKDYCAAYTAQSTDTPYFEADTALRAPLTDWLVNLWLNSTPFATASLYLDIISSLYGSAAKAGQLPPTKLFSRLKADLKALGADGWKKGIDDEIFNRALRLTKNAAHLVSDDAVAAGIILWSLTHSLMPFSEVALLKKEDLDLPEELSAGADSRKEDTLSLIIDQLSLKSQRRQYVFPLRQSQRTPKQLNGYINKIINALFRRARLPQADNSFDTVESLWAYAALRTGLPASAIVSHLGHAPLGLPILKLSAISSYCEADTALANTALRADTVVESFSEVGKIFLDNPPCWYAMSLRPGVRFTQVCRRLQLLGDRVPDIQLFYPCEEIARSIGKKIVTRQRPFIHSAVFFRAKLTDIGRIFSKIGDLAWCYRQNSRPGAPYAHISERQFQLFQQTIARFTPDYEVASIGELELKEGDRVEILGGLFQGQQATVVEEARVKGQEPRVKNQGSRPSAKGQESRVKNQGKGVGTKNSSLIIDHSSMERSTVYRLNIVGDNGIEWRITVDPRLTQKQ